ncbi:hypothetical protein EKO27_g4579 [Xylaria grammica]|uniref:Nephrocystin 3-like N-terminal domain-containing protein n=1 Tax=Xylaria grammica TaxID=363999 RepID=A0A439D7X8_9PEZI|nr:hypothetical protein EKO27_g4579 [Xylaria grammica]
MSPAMDPLSGIAFVAGIIQLIDLSSRLAFECSRQIGIARYLIHDAATLKANIDEIMTRLQPLRQMAERTDMERTVIQCFEHCMDTSAMIGSLQMMNPKKRASLAFYIRLKLSSLCKQLPGLALRSMREWQELEFRYTSNLCSKACSDYNFSTHSTSSPINRVLLARSGQRSLGPRLLHLLTSDIPASSRDRCEMDLKYGILDEIYKGAGQPHSSIVTLDPAYQKKLQQKLLRRLDYPGINDRYSEIFDAPGTSFSWILDPSTDSGGYGVGFRHWLSDSRGLYYIKGKAGAGKSTLMKYLHKSFERVDSLSFLGGTEPTSTYSKQSECDRQGNQKAYVASFFFKGTGTTIQKSSVGFLRSILLQILSQDPTVIPSVAPSRWEALLLFGEDPKPLDLTELQQMVVSSLRRRHEFETFLLVDGLDECRSPAEVLDLLHNIGACPGVKICISSRSLPELRRLDSAPMLTLENCTWKDVEDFVASKIEAQLSLTSEPNIGSDTKEELVDVLTRRASGCFLWVALVVKSLREMLENGKRETDLLRFVCDVPVELEGLYDSLLDELKASKPSIASLLHFICLSREPISLLRLSYMEMKFPESVLHQEISPVSEDSLKLRVKNSIESIVFRSKGFLVIIWPESSYISGGFGTGEWDGHIDLIHYSAREYFEAETSLNRWFWDYQAEYDHAARYCAASLSLLKTSALGDHAIPSVSIEAFKCAYMAMFTSEKNVEAVILILDEVESICYALLETPASPSSLWTDVEQNATKFHSIFADQFPMERLALWHWSGTTITGGNKGERLSAKLRGKVIALCSKYGFANLGEAPRMTRKTPEFEIAPSRGDISVVQWLLNGRTEIDAMQTETGIDLHVAKDQSALDANNIAEETRHATNGLYRDKPPRPSTKHIESDRFENVIHDERASSKNRPENAPRQFRASRLEIFKLHLTKDASSEDDLGIHDDEADYSDDVEDASWGTTSSTECSLGGDHPLTAFKDEAIQAVLRGFIEYRKNAGANVPDRST